ncbi:MAG: hypothetical protein EOO05_00220 [Chitinophagaceae bacterium]|nr:MAG: hypothetical protein EOO05_00220 [Chitinophagaceae bacterium]
MKKSWFITFLLVFAVELIDAQVTDTLPGIPPVVPDTPLRITNLNPYFTLQVDSMLSYQLSINKDPRNYYWYLRNSPAGMKINKDNGILSFKAERSFFLSGKLKYDQEYNVRLGVQNLSNPGEHIDTSFTLVFFNTDVINPKIKFTVASPLIVEEGKPVTFSVLCESGNFPIEDILFSSSIPITGYTLVKKCEDQFSWTPSFDFVSAKDTNAQKLVVLSFVGSTRFNVRDTASVRVIVRDALNYPYAVEEHTAVTNDLKSYVLQLKFAFFQLDKKVRGTKGARTGFDLTAATSALTGTILNTSSSTSSQNTGKVLPSVGVALTPIKEATAPNKTVEQNQAAVIRSAIRRLEYMERDNRLVGERDPDITAKTQKLREEVRQVRNQLVDIPLEMVTEMSEAELTKYMNSKKVRKKYGLSKK